MPSNLEAPDAAGPGEEPARAPRRSVSFGLEDSIAPAPTSGLAGSIEGSAAFGNGTGGSGSGSGNGVGGEASGSTAGSGISGAAASAASALASVAGVSTGTGSSSSSAATSGGSGAGTILPASASGSSLSSNPTPGSTAPSTPGASLGLRSALKPSASAYRKLPPAAQYQHPDPLLRRLRLVDEQGRPVRLKEYFGRDVKCVGFYFSSQWAGQPLKEYHKTITHFSARHANEFKVIYVSVDVDEQWYKAGTKGKPWVSMVWNDGSSPVPPENGGGGATAAAGANGDANTKTAGVSSAVEQSASMQSNSGSGSGNNTLYNSEDFLLGGEPDIDESLSHSDTSGEAYLRPFSRVHLAGKLNIIAAPTLCVYHLPSQRMLDWNVRMGRLQPGREEATWERWRRGEKSASAGVVDAFAQRPFSLIMLGLSIVYWLFIYIMGPEYNFLVKGLSALGQNAVQGQQGGAFKG